MIVTSLSVYVRGSLSMYARDSLNMYVLGLLSMCVVSLVCVVTYVTIVLISTWQRKYPRNYFSIGTRIDIRAKGMIEW